jgi:hypothetical protein
MGKYNMTYDLAGYNKGERRPGRRAGGQAGKGGQRVTRGDCMQGRKVANGLSTLSPVRNLRDDMLPNKVEIISEPRLFFEGC